MLTGETTMELRIMRRQGLSIRAISRDPGVSGETVRKYLRAPAIEPSYGPRAPRGSKLDPFKDYLRMRLREALSAERESDAPAR